jgi:hypothetical protein
MEEPAEELTNEATSMVATVVPTMDPTKVRLLPTISAKIKGKGRKNKLVRCLVDTGSQISLITSKLAKNLKLDTTSTSVQVSGLGEKDAGQCTEKVLVQLRPHFKSAFKLKVELVVMNNLSKLLTVPNKSLEPLPQKLTENFLLADPAYQEPSDVDIILGVDAIPYIMEPMSVSKNGIFLQETKFGYIISGNAVPVVKCMQSNNNVNASVNVSVMSSSEVNSTDFLIQRFWQQEELTNPERSVEAEICEESFINNTERCSDGRYMVRLPFVPRPELGSSKSRAVAQFLNLETGLQRSAAKRKMYHEFMKEYIDMGHMSLVSKQSNEDGYYLPHHGILKETSQTTKLRVVFNASCPTTNGKSLNDVLLNGPKIQCDLTDKLIRWRQHKYVYTADAAKMFRQIWLHPDDRKYHKILWRFHPNDELQTYCLNTVTYGTKPATFLSVRCMQKLAEEEEDNHPQAAKIVKDSFYVDDLLGGAGTIEEARVQARELHELLGKGGFLLRKWNSNSPYILSEIPAEHALNSMSTNALDEAKILGIKWDPMSDNFFFEIKLKKMPFSQRENFFRK